MFVVGSGMLQWPWARLPANGHGREEDSWERRDHGNDMHQMAMGTLQWPQRDPGNDETMGTTRQWAPKRSCRGHRPFPISVHGGFPGRSSGVGVKVAEILRLPAPRQCSNTESKGDRDSE